MEKVFSWCAAVALGAAVMLSGCGKSEEKPAVQSAAQTQGRSVYGSAMEKAKSTDCLMQMRGLHGFWASEEYLPSSAQELSGATLKCPGSGENYVFLVTGRVRNAGKIPVLRCPTHELVLYSDGSASAGR